MDIEDPENYSNECRSGINTVVEILTSENIYWLLQKHF